MAGQGGLAEKIRTGLEETPQALLKTAAVKDPLDELWFRKPVRRHIREFGAVLAVILLIFAGASFYHGVADRGAALTLAGGVLYILGRRAPRVLKPVWLSFIKLGELLGHAVTFAVLFLTWWIALIPLALGMRMFGVRVMDMGFRLAVNSYWEQRKPAGDDFKLLKRQY